MNPYRELDIAFNQLNRRPGRRRLPADLGDLGDLVHTIRDDRPDSAGSDQALRNLIVTGRTVAEANTVVLHALAPALRASISRNATNAYHRDALAELALVVLDGDVTGTRLAARLVNRAHTRVWRQARRVRTHGTLNITTTVPCEPDQIHLLDHASDQRDYIEDNIVDRLDLSRFADAVECAIADGVISLEAWKIYRDHRLRRAVDSRLPPSTARERVAAHRAALRLAPYIASRLGVHAA